MRTADEIKAALVALNDEYLAGGMDRATWAVKVREYDEKIRLAGLTWEQVNAA